MKCQDCGADVAFWVFEQFETEDGFGAVERTEHYCEDCIHEIEPIGLDKAYANYEYRIDTEPGYFGMRVTGEE